MSAHWSTSLLGGGGGGGGKSNDKSIQMLVYFYIKQWMKHHWNIFKNRACAYEFLLNEIHINK